MIYHELGWGTTSFRREFHKVLFIHKIIHGNPPNYFSSLLPVPVQDRTSYSLRNNQNLTTFPTRIQLFYRDGSKSFCASPSQVTSHFLASPSQVTSHLVRRQVKSSHKSFGPNTSQVTSLFVQVQVKSHIILSSCNTQSGPGIKSIDSELQSKIYEMVNGI